MKLKILLFSCLLAATFVVAQPQDTCQDNTPISGSNNWWSCNWRNTYTCGGFCCCENGFEPEERGYCVSCPEDPCADALCPAVVCNDGSNPPVPDGACCGDRSLCPPVNCVMNDWQNSGECSATCGEGLQTQTRSVRTPAANGGTSCPASSRTIPCSTTACPVNCVMNDWQNSGECSATCGEGLQTQTRSVRTPMANGGTVCPASSRTIPCSATACPLETVCPEGSHAGDPDDGSCHCDDGGARIDPSSDPSVSCSGDSSGAERDPRCDTLSCDTCIGRMGICNGFSEERCAEAFHLGSVWCGPSEPSQESVCLADVSAAFFDYVASLNTDECNTAMSSEDDSISVICDCLTSADFSAFSAEDCKTDREDEYTIAGYIALCSAERDPRCDTLSCDTCIGRRGICNGFSEERCAEAFHLGSVWCGPSEPSQETCSTCRIRRNWNGMEDVEKKEYIDTVNIARTEEPYKSQYDALVMQHGELSPFGEIHDQVQFLAWHRWFIFEYENILRQITPCITVPYWAWEVAGDNWHQDEIWGTEDHQFGSCGNGDVNDGPFSGMILPGTDVPLSRDCWPGRGLPKISDLQPILNESPDDFGSFFNGINSFHGWVHIDIGGSMGSFSTSGMAPEFFLHHNNVDRIWTNWQLQSESHELAQPSRDATLSGTDSTYTVDDFTRARDQAGACVEYDDHIVDTSGRRRLSARFTKVNLAAAISNQLPKDVAFRNLLVHTNELSLQVSEDFEAEQLMFAANQRGESLSDERAHEIAHLHQVNSNWGKYIRERQVDTEYVPDSEAKAFFTDIVGITAESVRHALETTHKFEGLQAFDRQWTEFEQLFGEN